MSDDEPETYRPRRAAPEDPAGGTGPDTEPTKPLYRDEVDGSTADTEIIAPRGRRSAESPSSADDQTQILSRARAARAAGKQERPGERDRAAKSTGARTGAGKTGAAKTGGARSSGRGDSAAAGGDPRRSGRRAGDDEATTLLPRTSGGSRVPRHDDDDIDPPPSRRRTALLVVAVAAVVIIGLAVGYAAVQLSKPSAVPGTTQPPAASNVPTPGGDASPSTTPSASPAALLTDASMVTAESAKALDGSRTWKIAQTLRGRTSDSPQAACLGGDPVEGQPDPQQTILRLISSDGSAAPALLHEANAYATPEEAAQAYTTFAKSLGGCTMAGAYIASGRQVTGLGDQSTGLVVDVVAGETPQQHSLVLTRTGRVVDIIDVAQPEQPLAVGKVATLAGTAVKAQCTAAGGSCTAEPQVEDGPPPVGGDQPGLLAAGDLPPVGTAKAGWYGSTPAAPDGDQLKGSGCETVDWGKVEATQRIARTYLVQDSATTSGLDEVVVTTGSDSAAGKLAEKVRDDWNSCEKRQLTAKVASPDKFTGVGSRGSEITGWTTTVVQKSGSTEARYRVGVASVGKKVVFVFLNPQKDVDLSPAAFQVVTDRAAQRATQVA